MEEVDGRPGKRARIEDGGAGGRDGAAQAAASSAGAQAASGGAGGAATAPAAPATGPPAAFPLAKKLWLSRDAVVALLAHSRRDFEALVRGRFVRHGERSSSGEHRSVWRQVLGLGRDASQEYVVDEKAPAAAQARTRVKLRLRGKGGPKYPYDTRLSAISNTAPSEAEYAQACDDARAYRYGMPSNLDVTRALDAARRRLDALQRRSSVRGVLWGCRKGLGHQASVLFRSWHACVPPRRASRTGADAQRAATRQAAASGAVSSTGGAVPRGFRASFDTDIQRGDEADVSGAKFRGEFHYLLQHRSPTIWGGEAARGADMLGLAGGQADAEDKHQPDASAWREACEELCPGLPLEAFRAAIVAHIDDVWESTHGVGVDGGEERAPQPQLPSMADTDADGVTPSLDDPPGSWPKADLSSPHQVFVVDADALVRGGFLPPQWAGTTPDKIKSADELSFARFPTGHTWVPESFLREVAGGRFGGTGAAGGAGGDAFEHGGVKLWPRCAKFVQRNAKRLVAFRRGNVRTLYHGTGWAAAQAIQRTGFLRPKCKNIDWEAAPPRAAVGDCRTTCHCQMLGYGVYLAREDKARRFAEMRHSFDPSGGALITVSVDLGYTKRAVDRCPECTCAQVGVQHRSLWSSRSGYDSIVVPDRTRRGGRDGPQLAEWAVADPDRITIVSVERVGGDASK